MITEIRLEDGDVVDTYGGDYTYYYAEARFENDYWNFYEWQTGAKDFKERGVYPSDDKYEELKAILLRKLVDQAE